MWDVVTLGETMIRFSPTGFQRLENAAELQLHVGGSESNTAVGLARLGRKVCWISRLTNNPFGKRIEHEIRSHGVDTSRVVWTDQDRVGLYFLETGSPPRASQVVYDRANSAFSMFRSTELDESIFQPDHAKWLHITGISMALSKQVGDLITRAVILAKSAGWRVSFDVNYRALLWSPEQAKVACDALFREADLVFAAKRDLIRIWGLTDSVSPEDFAVQVDRVRGGKATVISMGELGATASREGEVCFHAILPVPPIGRLGGGDAFSAGYLHAWLEDDRDIKRAIHYATTAAAIKYSIPGDMPWLDKAEFDRLVGNSVASIGLVR